MIKIRCVVERITYQSPETGYTVLKCAVKNYNDLVTVVGNLVDANVGSVLLIDGNWKVDAKYGRQFLAESWEETMPATVFGIEKYLGSGLIKGVGPKFAKKIVQQFSTDTLEIIETDVQRLLEVPGIGKKRVDKIAKSWERQKEIKNVMLFLQDHSVSTAFAAKIYRQYGNESIPKVKENPFRLADDIWGIGFKTADSIAMKLGIGKEAFIRLRSGIMYTLSELADEGHVYAERDQLIKKASALLEAEGGHLARRLSGGGAVFHDLGNLNFTFLVPAEDYDVARQLAVIAEACRSLGIGTETSGRNDLLADGRKFSGNAFYQSGTNHYHHGTLLVDVDTERMGRYLSPSQAKLAAKGVSSVRSRVVNLRELRRDLTIPMLREALTGAFSQVYGLPWTPVDVAELDQDALTNLSNIGEAYLDPSYDPGNVYSVPYQGGVAAIAVNTSMVDIDITSYADLFDSALADSLDYYYVPTFCVNGQKIHEGVPTKEKIRAVYEAALDTGTKPDQ